MNVPTDIRLKEDKADKLCAGWYFIKNEWVIRLNNRHYIRSKKNNESHRYSKQSVVVEVGFRWLCKNNKEEKMQHTKIANGDYWMEKERSAAYQ